MKRVTYRVYVDAPEEESTEALVQAVEDALEGLAVGGRTVEYQRIGTASGLPDPNWRGVRR